MEMVVGEGGQPVEWFWNLQHLKLAELVVKNLPEEYPCGLFPWEEQHGRTGEADEATREAERENADAVMDAMLKRAMAANDGCDKTLDRDGEKDD